jgi:hypothetical protein
MSSVAGSDSDGVSTGSATHLDKVKNPVVTAPGTELIPVTQLCPSLLKIPLAASLLIAVTNSLSDTALKHQ